MDSKKIIITTTITALVALLAIVLVIIGTSNKEFEVKLDSAGASGVDVLKIQKNKKIERPADPVRPGYTFLGWYHGEDKWDFDTKVTESITLIAKWNKDDNDEVIIKNFTVIFNSDGGTVIKNQTIEEGESVSKPANPTKEGYQFLGWYDGDKEWDFDKVLSNDITLVAKWEKTATSGSQAPIKTFKVTFNSNGGSSVKDQTIREGASASKPANPTRAGYKFINWTLNGQNYNFNNKVTQNITLTAKWEKTSSSDGQPSIKTYKVTFNSNGGSPVNEQTIKEGASASKPANPTRAGYQFIGWILNGQNYNFSDKVTKNITLTAKWEEIIVYEVQLELINENDSSTPEMKAIVYRNGTPVTASELYGDDKLIGRYVSSIGAIRVNKYEFSQSSKIKVKFSDNNVVEATKK